MAAVQAAWSLNALERHTIAGHFRKLRWLPVFCLCLLKRIVYSDRGALNKQQSLPRRELEPDKPARYYYSIAYAQFLRDGKKNFQQIYILQDHVPQ